MWVDSHCHLNLISNKCLNLNEVIIRAKKNGVNKILCPSTDLESSTDIFKLFNDFECIVGAIGIHPSNVYDGLSLLKLDKALVNNEKIVAIGETGLDYCNLDKNSSNILIQKKIFEEHILLSIEVNKPLIIHARNSFEDILSVLNKFKNKKDKIRGVFHCFTGNIENAMKIIELGFYIGVSGIITFKNAVDLCNTLSEIPIEKLILETDSPWLAPTPYRGSINLPEYIPLIGKTLSKIKGVSEKLIMNKTTENFEKLFS